MMSVCVRGSTRDGGSVCVRKRESRGIFTAGFARFPSLHMCLQAAHEKSWCVRFCMEEEFIHACAPT